MLINTVVPSCHVPHSKHDGNQRKCASRSRRRVLRYVPCLSQKCRELLGSLRQHSQEGKCRLLNGHHCCFEKHIWDLRESSVPRFSVARSYRTSLPRLRLLAHARTSVSSPGEQYSLQTQALKPNLCLDDVNTCENKDIFPVARVADLGRFHCTAFLGQMNRCHWILLAVSVGWKEKSHGRKGW